MHAVVDQAGMAARRDAVPYRFEEGFVGDGVLQVGKMVADVGNQLDQSDAEIRGVALDEGRVELRQKIEKQLAEAGVVLSLIVEQRLDDLLRRADQRLPAVEVHRARSGEVDLDAAQKGVELRQVDLEQIARGVAALIEIDDQRAVGLPRDLLHLQPDDAHAAADLDAGGVRAKSIGVLDVAGIGRVGGRHPFEEVQVQQAVIGGVDLEEVNAVDQRVWMCADVGAPPAQVLTDRIVLADHRVLTAVTAWGWVTHSPRRS